MQAYHEIERPRLSEKRIYVMKNTVSEPIPMARLHWHNAYELLLVRRGCGEHRINREKIKFNQGDVMVIRPGDVHTTFALSEDGCEIDVIQFIGEYFGDRADMLSEVKTSAAILADGEIRELFDRVTQSAGSGVEDSLRLSGALFMLCGAIIEKSNGGEGIGRRTEFAEAVCRHVAAVSDVSLKSVSKAFGYSSEHFSRRFHGEVGVPYKYYCERIKMQKIIGLLEDNEASAEQIAERAGYSDASSFTRAFKRIYGMTPGAYRALKIR